MKKIAILILILFSVKVVLIGQENNKIYKTQIVNSQNSEPLPFATILMNKNRHRGTVTNLNGLADLYFSAEDSCIQISYVGYQSQVIDIKKIGEIIKLKAIDVELEEVVVYSRENPAHRIIKKAVKNRKMNNPDKISEYGCEIYNKSIYDYIFEDDYLKDTSMQGIVNLFSENYVLLMESATDRFYKAPDKTFEIVKKVRASGFKDPSFAPLSSDVQPFHFYKPLIEIFDISYLNPISLGSHRKYFFLIEDTLYNQNDTTFIISFKPKKNTNFEGLKGFVHINTNRYAIENVVASPAEKKLMAIYIQQKYKFKNNYWFPKEIKSELKWEKLYNQGLGMRLKSESYVENFRTNIPEDSVKYTEEVLVFDKQATKDASIEMNKFRNTGLNLKEQNTYSTMDSLGEEYNFDFWMTIGEKLSDGKFPVKKFYIPLDKIYTRNDFEGIRIGLGLYTDDRLIKWLEAGGWGAYGFRDKEWKYGGDFTVFFDRKHETALSAEYIYDAVFPGNQDFARKKSYIEGYFLDQADYSTQMKASFKTQIRYFQLKFDFLNDVRNPQYNYSFLLDNAWVNQFETSELGVQLRFAFKEKYMWQLKQKIAFETKWPVLTVGYKKGLKNFYGGELDYDKLWAQIDYSYNFARLGKTNIELEAGKIWGEVPYSFLFAGAGGWESSMPVYVENRFNTMAPNEFANNEIASLFFSHDFGTRLFSTPKWKPKVLVTQAIGYGWLHNTNIHQGLVLTDMSKGYFENGLIFNDIVRLNVVNFFYLGAGAGIFYNYGYYSSNKQIDNLKLKLTISVSF